MQITTYAQAVDAAIAAIGDELAERGDMPDDNGLEDAELFLLYMRERPAGEDVQRDGGLAVFVDKATGAVSQEPTWAVAERLALMQHTR